MTRPIGGKPESTQDRYNDVHSVGSSFGAELDEDAVRKLLGNQVENPFASIVVGLAETVTDILGSVAKGILGFFVPGAKEGVIRDAIVAVMEPLESQVYTLGANLTALSDETKLLIGEQAGLVDEANAALEIVKATLAEQATKNEEFQSELATAREETSTAITQAGEAVSLARSFNETLNQRITTEFNKATNQATAAVDKANTLAQQLADFKEQHQVEIADALGKAEQAVADLATLTPQVSEVVDKAAQTANDLESLTSDVEVTQVIADKALTDLKNLSVGGRNLLQRVVFTGTNSYQRLEDTGEDFWTGEPIYKGTKLTTGTPPIQVSSSITFEPGDEYTASIWAKGEGLEGSKMTASFLLYSGKTHAGAYSEGDGTQWTRIAATWKNDTSEPVRIWFYFYLNRLPGEITYFTSPQIERGNVVTDWTPPIEDFTAEFSDIREDLNQKHTEAMDKAGVAVDALPGINDQLTAISEKADQGIADAKAVNDKLPAITQQVSDLTTEQGNLADGLSQAATQEDYNSLNTAFQQEQVKINNLNTSFQEEQTKLNDLTADFQAYQTDLNLKQQDWNLGAQRALKALEDVAEVQKEVNSNNEAFQDFQLDVNESRAKWEQGATLAIDNLTDFSAKQTKWNAAVDRSIATQKTVNDNFSKWTEGAATAIQANTDVAVALARINGIQVGGRNLLINSYVNETNAKYPTAKVYFGDSVPEAGEEVTISVKGSPGEGTANLVLHNSGGSSLIGSWSVSDRDSDGIYRLTTKWRSNGVDSYINVYLTLESGATRPTSTIEWVKLERGNQATDWTPAPEDLPTQKQVDDTQSTAIRANTDAIKALGKKSLGASLVPYKTPSDQEVKDYSEGKLSYDPWAEPEYYEAGWVVDSSPGAGKRTPKAVTGNGVKSFSGSLVSVDSSINYRVKFRTYAGAANSGMSIMVHDQDGNSALEDTPFTSVGKGAGYLLYRYPLPAGWADHEGVITFKPGVKEVRLSNFYWNSTSGVGMDTTTTQRFFDLEIVPDVPTQEDLNQSFQDNFERIDGELGLIKSTDQVWKDNQTKVTESLTKATEANTQALTVQKNLNNLFQEQLWAQLDMIEQLELQSPRVYHQNVDDGKLISNIPSWVGWNTAREYKNTFINFYHRNSDTKQIAWQATGRWEGQVRVTMNWSNGATDVWVYTIHKDRISRGDSSWSGRTFFNSGGASLVYHRNTTFEVYPKHLGRWFNLFWKPEDSSWYHSTTALDIRGVEGGPNILRWDTANAKENPGIRLTTSFSCNQPLTLTDMTGKEVTYPAGATINPQVVDVSKLDKTKQYRFEEVGIHW